MENAASNPQQSTVSTPPVKTAHFMSFNQTSRTSSKKKMLLSIIVLLSIILAVILYTISQKRSVNSKADEAVACHNGTLPAPADPNCYICKNGPHKGERGIAPKKDGSRNECVDGAFLVESPARHEWACSWCPEDAPTRLVGRDDDWASCPAPMDGFCKAKTTICMECRSVPNVPFTYCQCSQPSPTPPPPPKCPYVCIPASQSGSCKPGSSVNTGCGPDQVCCQQQPPTPIPTKPTVPTPTKPPLPTPTVPDKPTPTVPPSSCPVPNQVEDLQIYCPSCKKF